MNPVNPVNDGIVFVNNCIALLPTYVSLLTYLFTCEMVADWLERSPCNANSTGWRMRKDLELVLRSQSLSAIDLCLVV